jgi:hypothetical protein
MMPSRLSVLMLLLIVVACAVLSRPSAAQQPEADVNAAQVRESIARGVRFLRDRQEKRTGSWSEQQGFPEGGISALCTLALLNSGVPVDDPVMVSALNYVRKPKDSRRTYSVSLETMVLCTATPEKDRLLIRQNVAWLQRNQVPEGVHSGAWSYAADPPTGDPSNTQFALLGLYEAERIGVDVPDVVWRRSLGYWTRLQREDGSWAYNPQDVSRGSMTCAGIASTIIALGQVSEGDAKIQNGQVLCCQPQADHSIPTRGLQWLARNFSVTTNPTDAQGRGRAFDQTYLFYYLYGMERVGRMTANRFIGDHDWYREGAQMLLKNQDRLTGAWKGSGGGESNPDIATSLALLFLSKGRRPVVAAKLKLNDDADWNRHRSDLAHLTRHVERRWRRDLTWQVVDGQAASLEDLLQTPVLYLCGRDELKLTAAQKQLLKDYIEQGGFIFAESCCQGNGFDRDFRQLMAELFPDSPLRLLPPDHPIWYAEQKVPSEHLRPLLGVDACCRTSIVYCPEELSCYWELAAPRVMDDLPQNISDEIQATLAIGANVLTYATNRELKEKLDTPQLIDTDIDTSAPERATLFAAKLQHGGGSDDAPAALRNLLDLAAAQLQLRIRPENRLLAPTAESLYEYPLTFMHGRRNFRFSPAERTALAEYVQRGGFVMADAICASEPFAESFRAEMRAIFPDHPLRPIPPDHPMLSTAFQGYDLTRVQLRNPRRGDPNQPLATRTEEGPPVLEGIEIDGRLVVVFSPFDLSCALENQASIECKGYVREDAVKIGINVVLFAMQQ